MEAKSFPEKVWAVVEPCPVYLSIITVILIVFAADGSIDWPWYIVLGPLWVPVVFPLIVIGGLVIAFVALILIGFSVFAMCLTMESLIDNISKNKEKKAS